MDKAKRKAIIAGNWKMNKTASEAAKLVDELIPAVKDASCEVVICTPFTDLVTAVEKTKGTNIHVGAENVHFEKSGAFTGEISADMLVDLGVEYVIVGHSERRQYFAETDQTVNKRALAALNAGLKVIICVGESLEQREEGVTEELVRMQTKIALREAAERAIPRDWAQKEKLGFPVPVVDWLRQDRYRRQVEEWFAGDIARRFFDIDELAKLLDEHASGIDRSRKIWIVLMFLLWYRVYFVDRTTPSATRACPA